MTIDYGKIRSAFPDKAWAYAEQIDSIKIGRWDGKGFVFYEPLAEDYLLELRVFNSEREIKFTGDKYRDTAEVYKSGDFIEELANARYYMYGEHSGWHGDSEPKEGFTPLWEERGGAIVFPAELQFPKSADGNDIISLKLGIRNFVRYNPVPVLAVGEAYDSGLCKSGAGALEVVDYAYTGFCYADGKAVDL